jgi:hypothetical protein
VTFPAGLRVVEGPKAIAHTLSFIEFVLIGLMGHVVYQAVTFVIESRGCFRILWAGGSESNGKKCNSQQEFH